jgi:hypothetical protein
MITAVLAYETLHATVTRLLRPYGLHLSTTRCKYDADHGGTTHDARTRTSATTASSARSAHLAILKSNSLTGISYHWQSRSISAPAPG